MILLTTIEAAEYLRLGERKLYELVAAGAIPCTKVSGKWLFPREELDRWISSGLVRPAGMAAADPPPIVGGSQDSLLEWSLRESGSGLATLSEGTESGVGRLLRGEVVAAAIHFHSALDATGNDNIDAVRSIAGLHDAVLIGFARREQGLLVQPGNPKGLKDLSDVIAKKAVIAMRQHGAGAQMLLNVLLQQQNATIKDLNQLDSICLTGPDLAALVRSERADCGIATRAAARSGGLDFVPLVWEHFDLLTRQRLYFRQSLQSLVGLMARDNFRQRADELGGYDVATAGTIRFAS